MQKRSVGKIFFPENPSEISHGAWLEISETGIYLEASFEQNGNEQLHWKFILGEFEGLGKITLVDCYPKTWTIFGTPQWFINISYILKGFHALNLNSLLFNELILSSPALNNWIQPKDTITNIDTSTYKVPSPEKICQVSINNRGFDLYIIHRYTTLDYYTELRVYGECIVLIKFNTEVDLNEIRTVMLQVKKMILFLTDKNPEFKWSSVKKDKLSYEIIEAKEHLDEKQFYINIPLRHFNISNKIDAIVRFWFAKKELTTIMDLVLEKQFNPNLSKQGYFLNICFAIEIFQTNFGNKIKRTIEAKDLKNLEEVKILLKDRNDLFKWINNSHNNPSLKNRLYDYKLTIQTIMDNTFDYSVDTFIIKAVQNRNEITHRGQFRKDIEAVEAMLLATTLQYTIKLELLKIMGINIDDEKHSLINHAKKNIKHLAEVNWR